MSGVEEVDIGSWRRRRLRQRRGKLRPPAAGLAWRRLVPPLTPPSQVVPSSLHSTSTELEVTTFAPASSCDSYQPPGSIPVEACGCISPSHMFSLFGDPPPTSPASSNYLLRRPLATGETDLQPPTKPIRASPSHNLSPTIPNSVRDIS